MRDEAADPGVDVAIIGGGITGLAAAHRLREIAPDLTVAVLEAGDRPGGVLGTIRRDGYLIEQSADSFITNVPWAIDLCRRLGLEDRLIQTDERHRRSFVVRKGKLEPIPDGLIIMAPSKIGPMARTRILSIPGKLRLAMERVLPKGDGADESLASFARRRFGREAYDRLIQPLVGGMYTGDPERLSVKATMPRFLEMEQNHGSLIKAMSAAGKKEGPKAGGSGARYGLFVGLEGGMSELVAALVASLPEGAVRTGAKVERMEREGNGWRLRMRTSDVFPPRGGRQTAQRSDEGDDQRRIAEYASDPQASGPPPLIRPFGPPSPARGEGRDDPNDGVRARAVLLATPPRAAGGLLRDVDADVAAMLDGIVSTSSAIVSLGYRREQIAHPLDGFGFVVPFVENRAILSGSFSSVKFAGRAPEGSVLIRVFMGGAKRSDLVDAPDVELVRIASAELASLLGIRGEPELGNVSRWKSAMPQYEVGHLERVAEIERRIEGIDGLELAGNWLAGVGVPMCVRAGEQAAERIASRISAAAGRAG
ncbi:protoporphyrinogen oxidase [Paludisphaera rhizosphaerae]|uniref:protoporphyrinogen oxidase n=1 Tax=Paludisphaera rhizosphaerae TaxID=2711216 RepID=UPI0013ED5E5C|nr:protoporphyrinogen oxidase [Paludisphaera rhizosphaerae]